MFLEAFFGGGGGGGGGRKAAQVSKAYLNPFALEKGVAPGLISLLYVLLKM